jgi:hypothetical protein
MITKRSIRFASVYNIYIYIYIERERERERYEKSQRIRLENAACLNILCCRTRLIQRWCNFLSCSYTYGVLLLL